MAISVPYKVDIRWDEVVVTDHFKVGGRVGQLRMWDRMVTKVLKRMIQCLKDRTMSPNLGPFGQQAGRVDRQPPSMGEIDELLKLHMLNAPRMGMTLQESICHRERGERHETVLQ